MYLMRTGQGLATLNSRDLFCVAYTLLFEYESLRTEEEEKARQKVRKFLRGIEYEHDTGMPAISQWMRPANEL